MTHSLNPETSFGQLPVGQRFLDLTGGSWWVKTGSYRAACGDPQESAYKLGEQFRFRADETVSLNPEGSRQDKFRGLSNDAQFN